MNELDRILEALRTTPRGILVTVIRTDGSTYRRAGARAVIAENGRATGAISGGCLERDLAERIKPWLADMQPRIVTYDSTRADDLVFGLGLGCRGVLDLLIEPFDDAHPPQLLDFRWNGREPVEWTTTLPPGETGIETLVEVIRPQRTIVLFGSGADVEPVVRLAQQTGWRGDVVTTREPVSCPQPISVARTFLTGVFSRPAHVRSVNARVVPGQSRTIRSGDSRVKS